MTYNVLSWSLTLLYRTVMMKLLMRKMMQVMMMMMMVFCRSTVRTCSECHISRRSKFSVTYKLASSSSSCVSALTLPLLTKYHMSSLVAFFIPSQRTVG